MLRTDPTEQSLEFIDLLGRHPQITYDGNPIVIRAEATYTLLQEIASCIEINKKFKNANQLKNVPCIILNDAAYTYIVGKKSCAVTIHNMNIDTKREIEDVLNIETNSLNGREFILIRSIRGTYFPYEIFHEATHVFHCSNNNSLYMQKTSDYINNQQEAEAINNEMHFYKLYENNNFENYLADKSINKRYIISNECKTILKNIWDYEMDVGKWM